MFFRVVLFPSGTSHFSDFLLHRTRIIIVIEKVNVDIVVFVTIISPERALDIMHKIPGILYGREMVAGFFTFNFS